VSEITVDGRNSGHDAVRNGLGEWRYEAGGREQTIDQSHGHDPNLDDSRDVENFICSASGRGEAGNT
jgi:hypothetical protein